MEMSNEDVTQRRNPLVLKSTALIVFFVNAKFIHWRKDSLKSKLKVHQGITGIMNSDEIVSWKIN